MITQSSDTDPRVERVQIELRRAASLSRRFSLVRSLSQTVMTLSRRAIRRANPSWSEREVDLAFVGHHYGEDLAERLGEVLKAQTAMKKPDITFALEKVIGCFETFSILYYIGGAVASSAYGIARATINVDLVADVKADQVDILVTALETDYYIDANMIRDAIRYRSSFNLIHLETMVKIDVFIAKDQPYDSNVLARRQADTLDEDSSRKFYLASPEDIILHKLQWYEAGGRVPEQQLKDVLGVLKVQGDKLDLEYLKSWASKLNLSDLLNRSFDDAGMTGCL